MIQLSRLSQQFVSRWLRYLNIKSGRELGAELGVHHSRIRREGYDAMIDNSDMIREICESWRQETRPQPQHHCTR